MGESDGQRKFVLVLLYYNLSVLLNPAVELTPAFSTYFNRVLCLMLPTRYLERFSFQLQFPEPVATCRVSPSLLPLPLRNSICTLRQLKHFV